MPSANIIFANTPWTSALAFAFFKAFSSTPGLAFIAGADLEVTAEADVDAARVSGSANDSDDVSVSSAAIQMYAFMPRS
jgi:hypothetical protein